MKKIINSVSVLLTAIFILTMAAVLPVTAGAAEDSGEEISGGVTGDCTWNMNKDGILTISGNGRMADYDIDCDALEYNYDFEKLKYTYPWNTARLSGVVVEEGVTYIGEYAFAGCVNLETVSLPESLTEIGGSAFERCTKLKKAVLPKNLKTIGDFAFEFSGIESVNLPASIEHTGFYVFSMCDNLTDLNIEDGVTFLGYGMFEFCSSLTSVVIPDSVKTIESDAFLFCENLEYITFPNDLEDVQYGAFDITAWYKNQPDGLIYIGKIAYSFKNEEKCPSFVRIKPGTAKIADFAFGYCVNLSRVSLPEGLKEIGICAFANCENLSEINAPDSVERVGCDAFENTKWIENQPNGLVYFGKVLYREKEVMNKSVKITDGTVAVCEYAFYNNQYISSVSIPDSVEYIGPQAFFFCGKLRGITLPKNLKNVEPNTFFGCTMLKKVTITEGVEKIGESAFASCENLEQVIIPESVTEIADDAFDQSEKVVIYGYSGSYAEAYANENNIPFVALERKKIAGDINGDGTVDIEDATLIQKHSAKFTLDDGTPLIDESNSGETELADVNRDGVVSVSDATAIQRYIAGLVESL